MGTGDPAWVPGQAGRQVRERLLCGTAGLYGDLPPGVGPLLEVAAGLIARSFRAYAAGDWEASGGLVTEGRRACGEVFTAFAERIASPGFPYRVAGPFWDGFIARLALAVLRPEAGPGPAPVPPAPPRAGELAGELRVMGAEEAAGGFGAQYSDIDKVTAHHGDNHVPLVARHFRK